MICTVLVCFLFFVFVHGEMLEVKTATYKPFSQEEILKNYFNNSYESNVNRSKKSVLSVSDKFYDTMIEPMKLDLIKNISNLEKEINNTNGEKHGIIEAVQDYIRTGIYKNHFVSSVEPTTYRYPTAVWSSQTYEKLKNRQKFHPKAYTNRGFSSPSLDYFGTFNNISYDKTYRKNRGKTKWRDFSHFTNDGEYSDEPKVNKTDFVDKFLEVSLSKYLTSSNLKDTVGNVSVKTFSEILKNITDERPKRLQSAYDENKELRMKFRKEIVLRKKNETKPQEKFLEKQLQKRLERVQDVFNEKDRDKIIANMWRYVTLNRSIDSSDEKKTRVNDNFVFNLSNTSESTDLGPNNFIYETKTTSREGTKISNPNFRGKVKFNNSKYFKTEKNEFFDKKKITRYDGGNLLKLVAQESSYYRRDQFPSLTFIGKSENPRVIPGTPYVDYPIYSFPPPTKFKCPYFNDNKPKMMADRETRCQVFYICTGNGPTTAMLCPNGTMFNENFLVCDWWYNVNC